MKKVFSILTVFLLFNIFSCKKDNTSAASDKYYMKFKLNGKDIEYPEIMQASTQNSGPIYSCVCIGQKWDSGMLFLEGLTLHIASDSALAPNVLYTNLNGAQFIYKDSLDRDWGSGYSGNIVSNNIIITQLDSATITGTFSGTITSLQDFTTTDNITNGSFHLPIK